MSGLEEDYNTIKLNIGGTIFQCFTETLQAFPQSKLARIKRSYGKEHFFDRDPGLFRCILDAYRKGSIPISKDICGTTFAQEMEFWELPQKDIAPCCWKTIYSSEEDRVTMDKLVTCIQEGSETSGPEHRERSNLEKIWFLLDKPTSSRPAFVWGVCVSLLVIISMTAQMLQTLPQFWVPYTDEETAVVEEMMDVVGFQNNTWGQIERMKPMPELTNLEAFCYVILTLELLLMFAVCPNKRKLLSSTLTIILIIGYISYWIAFVMTYFMSFLKSQFTVILYIVLQYLSVLKIFRLFLVTRHIPAFKVLGLTFISSRREIKIFVLVLVIMMSLFGYAIYIAELTHNEKINDLPKAMYWALITLTTVGYGDYTPATAQGHVIAAICAVCGVLVLTMPIGIIAATFHSFYSCNKYATMHAHREKCEKHSGTSGI